MNVDSDSFRNGRVGFNLGVKRTRYGQKKKTSVAERFQFHGHDNNMSPLPEARKPARSSDSARCQLQVGRVSRLPLVIRISNSWRCRLARHENRLYATFLVIDLCLDKPDFISDAE